MTLSNVLQRGFPSYQIFVLEMVINVKQGCSLKVHRPSVLFYSFHCMCSNTRKAHKHPTHTPYLTVVWRLAELSNGLVELGLLMSEILLVEPEQLLTLSVLLLQA